MHSGVRFCMTAAVLATFGLGIAETTSSVPRRLSVEHVYSIEKGHAILPGYDDVRHTSRPKELARISPEEFAPPAKPYRGTLLMDSPKAKTLPFEMPERATTISLLASATASENIFPRLRITLTADDEITTRSSIIFEDFVQSLTLTKAMGVIPPDFRSRECILEFEVLNPTPLFEYRILQIDYVSIY